MSSTIDQVAEFVTKQRAYVGQYALADRETGRLIAAFTLHHRPRLYATAEAAAEAAQAIAWADCTPVRLV